MARFKFKGSTETNVELPDRSMINVLPGEVVELEHKLEDLAEHLWETTREKVGRPAAPEDTSPETTGEGIAPGASTETPGETTPPETPGESTPPPAPTEG